MPIEDDINCINLKFANSVDVTVKLTVLIGGGLILGISIFFLLNGYYMRKKFNNDTKKFN